MKLRGGNWSTGDLLALASLFIAIVTTALTVPEFRRVLGLDGKGHNENPGKFVQHPISVTPEKTNPVVLSQSTATAKTSDASVWQCIRLKYRPHDLNPNEARPNATQLDGSLLDLVAAGNLACAQKLLEAGANINAYRSSQTPSFGDGPPLHLALNQKHWEVALFLLSKGADPNLPTSYSDDSAGPSTALDMALGSSAPEYVVQALKEKGARVLKFK